MNVLEKYAAKQVLIEKLANPALVARLLGAGARGVKYLRTPGSFSGWFSGGGKALKAAPKAPAIPKAPMTSLAPKLPKIVKAKAAKPPKVTVPRPRVRGTGTGVKKVKGPDRVSSFANVSPEGQAYLTARREALMRGRAGAANVASSGGRHTPSLKAMVRHKSLKGKVDSALGAARGTSNVSTGSGHRIAKSLARMDKKFPLPTPLTEAGKRAALKDALLAKRGLPTKLLNPPLSALGTGAKKVLPSKGKLLRDKVVIRRKRLTGRYR